MTPLDILIAAPAIPVVPVAISWWLPWDRWIPWGKLPKIILGPYALYLAFAAWHFHFAAWSVLLIVIAGVVLTVMGAVENNRK